MSCREPAWPAVRRTRPALVTALLVLTTASAWVLGHGPWAVRWPGTSEHSAAEASALRLHGVGAADGVLPDAVTAFDSYPGVTNLDPALLEALRRASADAADDGTELVVNSGWRSPAYQERLLEDAVAEYGSRAEAARWVATPRTSVHVSGDAVDVGPSGAAEWLAAHGAAYGLCRTYDNEPWHFELRPEAAEHGCPPRYADPAHDPRMAQPR